MRSSARTGPIIRNAGRAKSNWAPMAATCASSSIFWTSPAAARACTVIPIPKPSSYAGALAASPWVIRRSSRRKARSSSHRPTCRTNSPMLDQARSRPSTFIRAANSGLNGWSELSQTVERLGRFAIAPRRPLELLVIAKAHQRPGGARMIEPYGMADLMHERVAQIVAVEIAVKADLPFRQRIEADQGLADRPYAV